MYIFDIYYCCIFSYVSFDRFIVSCFRFVFQQSSFARYFIVRSVITLLGGFLVDNILTVIDNRLTNIKTDSGCIARAKITYTQLMRITVCPHISHSKYTQILQTILIRIIDI